MKPRKVIFLSLRHRHIDGSGYQCACGTRDRDKSVLTQCGEGRSRSSLSLEEKRCPRMVTRPDFSLPLCDKTSEKAKDKEAVTWQNSQSSRDGKSVRLKWLEYGLGLCSTSAMPIITW